MGTRDAFYNGLKSVLVWHLIKFVVNFLYILYHLAYIHSKSCGEVSLVEQDTIENVS